MFAACGGFDLSLLPRLKNKFLGVLAAEGKGFEPLVRGYRTTVFKTVTFGRSVNLPSFTNREPASELLDSSLKVRHCAPQMEGTRPQPPTDPNRRTTLLGLLGLLVREHNYGLWCRKYNR